MLNPQIANKTTIPDLIHREGASTDDLDPRNDCGILIGAVVVAFRFLILRCRSFGAHFLSPEIGRPRDDDPSNTLPTTAIFEDGASPFGSRICHNPYLNQRNLCQCAIQQRHFGGSTIACKSAWRKSRFHRRSS
jgi:hypothetical protein